MVAPTELALPTIYDSSGNPMRRKVQYSIGDYDAAKNTRETKLHWGNLRPQTETELLPFSDRLLIIAYLRKAVRNNPVLAALAYRYALAIGSPTVHARGSDGGFNDKKERVLEKRLRNIMFGTGWSWHRLHKIISVEELIAGEVFAVDVEDKVQLIPSELCGSPAQPLPNEWQGIVYDMSGRPVLYRFGVRICDNSTWSVSRVSFEIKDGARLVPAEFVSHLGTPSRIEERRFSPKLAPVIQQIQNLDDIIRAKVTTVKNQAAMSLFMTKNFDPAMWADGAALHDVIEGQPGPMLDRILARTTRERLQDVKNGQIIFGEVGEDIKLLAPSIQAQDFDTFALSLVDQICAPVGMFAEEVLIGYRKSNYSSARADRNKLKDAVKDARKEREPFCDHVVERQTGIAVDSEEITDGNDGIADIEYGWPVVLEIDDTKRAAAQAADLANGTKSHSQICAENGNYGDQVTRTIMQDAAYKARALKAYATKPNPSNEEIAAMVVTPAEIVAQLPNAAVAAEAINAIANAEAAAVNAQANETRADATTA